MDAIRTHLYLWLSPRYDGQTFVLLAHADSVEDAISRILERLAATRVPLEHIEATELHLRESAPEWVDFVEGAGFALLPQTPQ